MERVTAGYAHDIEILQEVSLTLPEGQTVGVIGLNGAGKSTIMRTIYGFLHPKRGRIFLAGDDISDIPPHRMLFRRVWYIPRVQPVSYLTVEDNLALVHRKLMRARPVVPPRTDRRGARALPDAARAAQDLRPATSRAASRRCCSSRSRFWCARICA